MAPRRILISCGEPSGDLYAAALTTALRSLDPSIDVVGFGGPRLAGAGAQLIGDYRGFAVTGLLEAAPVLRRAFTMLRTIRESARAHKPDAFVAVDFPDFNFRLLPAMRRLDVPVAYYISPQLWAWRSGRVRTIRKYVDRMLVIFPFEVAFYERAGVPVEFVGHPLLDITPPPPPRDETLASVGFHPDRPVLAVLPGSRGNELRHLLPTMVDAAQLVARRVPGLQCLVARAPSLDDALFAPLDRLRSAGVPVAVREQATDAVLAASDVVLTASGTATVQAALHRRPMVIVYRFSKISSAVLRRLIRLRTYGMVNLVAGRPVVPELMQDDFTPERVAGELTSLLTDRARAGDMRAQLDEVARRFGGPGASARAAAAVLGLTR